MSTISQVQVRLVPCPTA